MKKVVIQLAILDEKDKKKVLRAVSGLSGVDSIAMDMKDKKLTVLGDVDPVEIVGKLRKTWHPDLITVGPAKEPEKKQDDNKKNTAPTESEQVADLVKFYKSYNHNAYMAQAQPLPYHYNPPYHYYSQDDPNSCVICYLVDYFWAEELRRF